MKITDETRQEKERSHQMRIRRTFSQEFKRQTAEAVISGKAVLLEITKLTRMY